jgi:hypothetical protein
MEHDTLKPGSPLLMSKWMTLASVCPAFLGRLVELRLHLNLTVARDVSISAGSYRFEAIL